MSILIDDLFQFHVVDQSRVICKLVLYFLSQAIPFIILAVTKAICLSKNGFTTLKLSYFDAWKEISQKHWNIY